MKRRFCLPPALLAISLVAGAPAAAHDFWLEPLPWNPDRGERVAVRARVGEGFRGETVLRSDSHIERFVAVDAEGERPVAGVAGLDPAGWLTVRAPGLHVVGYDSHRSTIELAAAAFESYLAAEGLERVLALRAERDAGQSPGREAFSRCAKSLFVAAGGSRVGFDRPLGLELELVPLADPFAAEPGRQLPVQVLFRGAPLAGVRVTAIPRDAPKAAVARRSDAMGAVELPIDRPGEWLVKAVHMREAPPGLDADWESWWASLTFAAPGE